MERRKLVTVRQITSLDPIPGADMIEVASIDGWKVIVKKGEFSERDFCIYFEIDSFLPESDPRYAFLMKASVRLFEGIRGHKLRTIKLRGQISQGLALPLEKFPELSDQEFKNDLSQLRDLDLTEKLGIKLFEIPTPAALAGQIKGPFPSFISKTDQERCQNLLEEIFTMNKDARYEVTTKLDGTSVTYYFFNNEIGACSRNLELKVNEENEHNTIIRQFIDSGLSTAGYDGYAIQGELMGPGIQSNIENLKEHRFYVFDVQNLNTRTYLSPTEREKFMQDLHASNKVNSTMIQHIPVLYRNVSLEQLGIRNVTNLLDFAHGPSINNPVREGIVFKREDGRFSFKVINNAFLANEKD